MSSSRSDELSHCCSICGAIFGRKGHLTRHFQTHDPNLIKFPCGKEGCTYSATQISNLTAHRNSRHSADRPFECTRCHRQFKLKPQLQKHEQSCRASSPDTIIKIEEEETEGMSNLRTEGSGSQVPSSHQEFLKRSPSPETPA
ncbi:hypothetical protein BOTBODRAFT_495933 [Botryobasidium botryosum FD-172 SS1]|uniref:C2H2-type domain-containing protein n=1 Tax=Botryobasidium botryosum (strain FD-172 SS1) TaxID=930990 RepID=A0A067MFR8_BOTB1|nr:hypothetical protein BOTBODRAFT_495933 [Botryobasidium botryosum FD-172 SS1]